ncbi:MAG: hypothetical protein WBF67_11295 [Olleya sp.]
MNKYTLLLLVILIAFLSCDGRDRVHKTPKEVLTENKLLDSFSENIQYFPKEYTETITDTILSNGFRVKIKTFTDMDNSVLDEFKQNNIHHKHYYRNNVSTILVTKNEIIFDELIDENFFIKHDNRQKDFFEELNLQGVWIDDEKSTLNSNVSIDVLFCKPETDICEYFNIKIENNGTFKIKNITEEKDTY